MYIPRVLSPKAMIPLSTSNSPTGYCYPRPHKTSDFVFSLPKSSHQFKALNQHSAAPNIQQQAKSSQNNHLSPQDINRFSKTKISISSSKQSKIAHLLQQINELQQNSSRFSSSFKTVCSQLHHHLQSQSLKGETFNNQIAEARIDMKQRQQDIRCLIDFVGIKEKISSIVDKSTDTEGSSSGASSHSGTTKLGSQSNVKSPYKEKRMSPKGKIFCKI